MGGQPNNQNAVSHGLRLTLSQTPKGCRYIQQATARMRETLRAITLERRGELGLYEEAVIQTACRWEVHSQLAARWLRLADSDLSASDKLAFSREVARASGERDKCLERLGLHKLDTTGIIDTFYQTPVAAPSGPEGELDSEHSDTEDNATAASVDTVVEQPVVEEPVDEEPVVEQPVVEQPVVEEQVSVRA